MSTKCMEIVNAMSNEDQDALLEKLDRYKALGIPLDKAQKMAAKDMIEELKHERDEFIQATHEQHPDVIESTGEVNEAADTGRQVGPDDGGDREGGGVHNESAPKYGTATEGSSSAIGYHFSQQARTRLSSAYYGRGLKGAEASRLDGRENEDIKPRVFFYVSKGAGVRPEFGVGPYAHQVRLDNLYDVTRDAKGIVRNNPGANGWERAVMQAGYDGYLADTGGSQKFAVLLGSRHASVPVAQTNAPGAKANPMPEPKVNIHATRKSGDNLVKKPTESELFEIINDRGAVNAAAPSFKMQYGEANVLASESAAADKFFGESGASFHFGDVQFSERQEDTPEFKAWFGDSKVVDAEGKPLVVYHGSGSPDIIRFKSGVDGAGWFARSPSLAGAFASEGGGGRGDTIYPTYLSLQNPLDVRTEPGMKVMLEANRIMPDGTTAQQLASMGYDGLISDEWDGKRGDEGTTYLAFKTTQIKSAIGNNGEFDPANPDIRYSSRDSKIPDAIIGHQLGVANAHVDYDAAKSGDPEAAARLANELVTSDLLEKIQSVTGWKSSILVPVISIEASGKNRIPLAVAGSIAKKLGMSITTNIPQVDSPKRTSMDGLERILNSPSFDGDVTPGASYILVDDTLTQGATFAALAGHITSNGGQVKAVVALTGKQYSATISPTAQTLSKLRENFNDIEPDFQAATGYGFDSLTESEARYIANFKPALAIRDRIIEAGSEAGSRSNEQDSDGVNYSSREEKPRPVYTHEVIDPRNGGKVMGKYQSKEAARRGRDRFDDKHGGYRYQAREIGQEGTMFSVRNGTSTWDMYEASKFDNMVYKLQNKMIDVKRVIESITKFTGSVAEDLNVYLQEELFHGRAAKRVHDFAQIELEPLMKEIKDAGYQLNDVEEYLHARHAKEANAVIASRDAGMPDGGSGMLDAQADAYMQSLTPEDAQKLQALATKVDAIVGQTRQLYVDYGLETQATVDSWNQMFKHYIPLQREDKEGSMGIGQGFSVKGKEARGRTGSRRKVVDILANVAMQRERLIVRGEKNRVSNALVGLASANPNPDFWTVGAPPTERVYDPKTNSVVDRIDPMYKSRENVLVSKVKMPNGEVKEVAVVFNEDDPRALRMAKALKNIDAGDLEGLLGVSAKITRYFSAVNTQYNPVFGVVNLMRDVQHAMITLDRTPLAKRKGRIARDTFSALTGIYQDMRAMRNGQRPTSQWAQLWEDFQNEGGQTGYRQMFETSADRADELKKTLDPDAWLNGKYSKFFTANGALKVPLSEAKKGAGAIFDWLSDYNESMENGVRLASYKAGLDQGMTKREAASLAKNLTVNFNRKGQVGQQAGAVYAFFNAAVQGTANIGQTLFSMEGGDVKTMRLSATGKKVVYGGMLIGSMQALALAAAGFNDDDPPDFIRARSLIIPTGGKSYVTIPMPQGFNVLPGIGRNLTEFALDGFKNPAKRAIGMFSLFADNFNPIGNAGLSMQTLAPTALDPLVALTENRDFTGKPIARVSSNKAIPGFTQFKDSATVFGKLAAEAINGVTGGNAYVAGALSPTPDQIDYLLGQVTGGVGRELSKVEQTALGLARGEDTPIYKIPLAGRFYGNASSQASQGGQFYANVNRLNELETEVKGMRKDGKGVEAAALMRSRPDAYLVTQANVAERQVQRLTKEKRALVAAGADRATVKAKEEQITAVMTRLNQAAERLKEKAAD